MKKIKIFTYVVLFLLITLNIISVRAYAQDNYVARTYIDIPTDQMLANHELEIEGWVMTNDEQSEISVYIDGIKQDIQDLQRIERTDVIKAINGYGGIEKNPMPGYKMKIDCSKIPDGERRVEVRIISRTGELLTVDSRSINLRKYVAKTYIDMPNNVNEYLIKDKLEVEGWVMSDDENYQIEAYIKENGKEEKQEIQNLERLERTDVLKAITGYGTAEQNQLPGFKFNIDTSEIASGEYNLEIRVVSRTGEILTRANKKVIIQRYTSRSYIDSPENNEILKPDSVISGWIMTDDEESQINIYIDGKKQKIKQITRIERTDVIKAIS